MVVPETVHGPFQAHLYMPAGEQGKRNGSKLSNISRPTLAARLCPPVRPRTLVEVYTWQLVSNLVACVCCLVVKVDRIDARSGICEVG